MESSALPCWVLWCTALYSTDTVQCTGVAVHLYSELKSTIKVQYSALILHCTAPVHCTVHMQWSGELVLNWSI